MQLTELVRDSSYTYTSFVSLFFLMIRRPPRSTLFPYTTPLPISSFATAGPARGAQFARSAAARAWHVEAHLARGLLDGTGAMAGRARLRRAHRPGAVTGFARVHSGDRELLHRAAQRVPEFNLDLVFQLAARLVFRPTDVAAPRAKKLAEKVPETRPAARPAGSAAEIKSAKVKVHAGIACALDRKSVV